MLYQANLPLEFRAEACSTAVYLHNRSPTAALKDETPFECLFGRKPDISNLRVIGCVSYVHIPDKQRRKLDAKAHQAIFAGYPPGVKGYKLYDLEKKNFVLSRDVQFDEENFDHFDVMESKDTAQAELRNIFSDMNEESESKSVAVHPLNKEAEVHDDVKVPVMKKEEPIVPEDVASPVEKNIESAVPQKFQTVGAPNEEKPVKKTYEDKFMEEVQTLGPTRQRRKPSRFEDDDWLFVGSEIDEPKTVEEVLKGDQCCQWREAMESEYNSSLKNNTWDLVPPPEGKNVVGSRWVLKVKLDEDGCIDLFKARLVAHGYSQVKGVDYDEVFSPVAWLTSVRSLLALANAQNLEIYHMDVKTAFFNGSLDCEI